MYNGAHELTGYRHQLSLISVVGTGLSLPFDVEPYAEGDSEYTASQRLLERAVRLLGRRFADYVVADGEYATAPFLHTAGELGLHVVAWLKSNLPELFSAAQRRLPTTQARWTAHRGLLAHRLLPLTSQCSDSVSVGQESLGSGKPGI